MKKAFIVYAHPSEDSFTCEVRDTFIKGLESAGHGYILSDLYRMNFKTDMSDDEYHREAFYRRDLPVPADVAAEQEKIGQCDALVFIYPVFWSDAPAKLKGWFDRVWTFGFAYGNTAGSTEAGANGGAMKQLEKGLAICAAGNTMEYFAETGLLDAMKKVMLKDRFFNRVRSKEMILLEATSREGPSRDANRERHLTRVFNAGKNLF
ncbi:flavodoxin family protein [Spirochaetia bacterium]|nr:flavodoxin family protein [Spirochaetia bacterium]